MNKNLFKNTFLLIALSCVLTSQLLAQDKKKKDGEEDAPKGAQIFECSTDLEYEWTPTPPAKNKRQTVTPKKEFSRTIVRHADSMENAKKELHLATKSGKQEAMEDCRYVHEYIANCVSRGLKKASKDFKKWDFNSRKAFMDALSADCKFQEGRCNKVTSTDPDCYEKNPAPVKEEANEDKDKEK